LENLILAGTANGRRHREDVRKHLDNCLNETVVTYP